MCLTKKNLAKRGGQGWLSVGVQTSKAGKRARQARQASEADKWGKQGGEVGRQVRQAGRQAGK